MPPRYLLPAVAGVVLLAVGASVAYDAVVAAAVLIAGVTAVLLGGAAADWEEHPSFEERELARARRRKERWEATADVRARDRARWEAYQTRKAEKAEEARRAERARPAQQAGDQPG